MKTIEIAPGVNMPILGLGTWEVTDKDTLRTVLDAALDSGYRFIDSAAAYGNEKDIGELLRELMPKYGLQRSDIFITSKLNTKDQGKEKAREAGLKSRDNLGFEYVDLYLIHFPGANGLRPDDDANRQRRTESWIELEKLLKEGVFRAIGVSNYMENHLDGMKSYATITPAVNQVEYHPHLVNQPLVRRCQDHGIHFQAYSSLGSRHSGQALLNEPLVSEMADKYKCNKTQLLLAWAMAQAGF